MAYYRPAIQHDNSRNSRNSKQFVGCIKNIRCTQQTALVQRRNESHINIPSLVPRPGYEATIYLATKLRQIFESCIHWNKTACNDGLRKEKLHVAIKLQCFPVYFKTDSVINRRRTSTHALLSSPELLSQATQARAEKADTQPSAYVDEFLPGVEVGHQPVPSFRERRQGDLHFAAS